MDGGLLRRLRAAELSAALSFGGVQVGHRVRAGGRESVCMHLIRQLR